MQVARRLGRNSIGIEIKPSLVPIIREKVGFGDNGAGATTSRKSASSLKSIPDNFCAAEDTFEEIQGEEEEVEDEYTGGN
jgi:hypothetical protein